MRNKLNMFFLTLIFGVVFWNFLLPGVRVANDFPIVSKSILHSLVGLPYTWSENGAEGLGEYTSFFLWSWPLTFISGFFSKVGFSFSVLERFLLLIPALIFGTAGIWKLSETLKLSNFAKLISSIIYLTNTYIILLIDGGQLSVALAYSFLPLTFHVIQKSITGDLSKRILAGPAIAALGFFDFRFIYILLLLCTVRFFYQFLILDRKDISGWIISWIKSGLVSGLVLTGLNAYWLIPLIKAPISSNSFSFFTQSFFLTSGNIGHSIMLLSPNWFENVFGRITLLRFEFIIIPILIFLAPILRAKNQKVGFWVLIAIISIFLTKGTSKPLPNAYQWLLSNVEGFSLFRDSTKFFVLLALAYSLLLGVTCDEIFRRLKNLPKLNFLFYLGIIFYLLFLIRPIFLNQMTGTFSKPKLENEYSQLSKILENDKNFSRVFWIPHIPPLGYSSTTLPVEEASRLAQRRPFNVGIKGTYETFNFLREAPYMGEIFDVSGIGYIVYPPLDPRRDDMHPDNIRYYQTFSKQLSDLNWLTKVDQSPVNLWKIKTHQDKFFITSNIWWIIGPDDIYKESTKSASLKLSKNALIFVEEQAGLGKRLDELPDAKIVLNNKTMTDLAASFIDPSHLIFPAKQLDFGPDKSGWWKREAADLIKWRDFLQTKYRIDNLDFDLGGGWAVGEGKLELRINPSTSLGTGNQELRENKVLLARVLESTRSGELRFYQEDNLIGQISTKNEGNNIGWYEVGRLVSDGTLTINSLGDINVVNALATLDKKEWENYKNKAQQYEKMGKIVDFKEENIKDSSSNVTYKQINPTKYEIEVKNLNKPVILVFSQTYDSFWKINGVSSLPAYSFLNGFMIEKDGKYIVEFEAQNWVYPGLVISGVTMLIILLIIFKNVSSKST